MKKIQNEKKGQVALEFLTTYGWAFMVALIAIGALAYFGVLNPSKYTSSRCTFGTALACNDFKISISSNNQNNVSVLLLNNIGSTVNVTQVSFNDTGSKYACSNVLSGASQVWYEGDTKSFSCQTANGIFDRGNKQKILVSVTYFDPSSGPGYTHVIFGDLYDSVQ